MEEDVQPASIPHLNSRIREEIAVRRQGEFEHFEEHIVGARIALVKPGRQGQQPKEANH